jgi:hypothetical protein
VVAAPPNVIGMFTDFFQRTITDVGLIGPDRARGGLYLLLPPHYDGQVPQGYFTFRPNDEARQSCELNVDQIGFCSGVLNADQHFGHHRFSSQILSSQSLPRSSDLAAVGSGSPVL